MNFALVSLAFESCNYAHCAAEMEPDRQYFNGQSSRWLLLLDHETISKSQNRGFRRDKQLPIIGPGVAQ